MTLDDLLGPAVQRAIVASRCLDAAADDARAFARQDGLVGGGRRTNSRARLCESKASSSSVSSSGRRDVDRDRWCAGPAPAPHTI